MDMENFVHFGPRISIRPAQIFLESRLKHHDEVWAKTRLETNFQPFLKSFDHASEAPKVPGSANSDPTLGPSEPPRRGQTTLELAENWSPGRFWPKLHRGV